MNKKLGLAVAGALLAAASSANAGITIPAGDWTVDIGGNVNAYYSHTNYSGAAAASRESTNQISTGLLPAAFGIGAKTRQNDLDVAFQFSFFTGTSSGSGTSAGNNTLNIRQAFLTFGDASWGTIKAGRDLGIYGSDAILSDMTLLGVGNGAGVTNGGSSTLGRIGSGYMYADWIGQIAYASPNWNGFSFAAAITEPWANGVDTSNSNIGYQGKVTYDFAANDVTGRVWLGGISQKHDGAAAVAAVNGTAATGTAGTPGYVAPQSGAAAIPAVASYTSSGFDVGAKASYQGATLVGYYYDGEGLSGSHSLLSGGLNGALYLATSTKTKDSGGYVQATFVIPGVGTKLGASWGESLSSTPGSAQEFKNESWIVGAYHPLTKSLNLVLEYTDQKIDNIADKANNNLNSKTVSAGAILFF